SQANFDSRAQGRAYHMKRFSASDSPAKIKAWMRANPGRGFTTPMGTTPDVCIHEGRGVPCHCQTPGAAAIRRAYRAGFRAKRAMRAKRRGRQWLKFAADLFALPDPRG